MRTLYKGIGVALFLFIASTPTALAEYHWLQDSTLKVTIETEEMIYEWEFENPGMFEYEEGHQIWRGEKAKDSFEELLTVLDLSEPDFSEEVIEKINDRYKDVVRLTVKRVNLDYSMQTWVWNKTEKSKDLGKETISSLL